MELGRDPATIGRSVGVWVHPLETDEVRPSHLSGPATRIAETVISFRDAGFTQVELMYLPGTAEAVEALAPVVEAIRAG
jgi:hypothetical protein